MDKKPIYPYDSYSGKDQSRNPGTKTWKDKWLGQAKGTPAEINSVPSPKSAAGKGDKENVFSAKRLKKGK